MKKVLKIVAIAFVAFGFSACDEVSKAVEKVNKATKSSASGDASAKETANSSVCKPYNSLLPIGNFDFNIAFKGIYYGTDGWTPRNTELEKMDKNLFRSYSTVAKQDDKETICLYFTAMRQGYLDVNLTPQDIEQFERFLAEIDRYDYYEKPEYQDKSLKLLIQKHQIFFTIL